MQLCDCDLAPQLLVRLLLVRAEQARQYACQAPGGVLLTMRPPLGRLPGHGRRGRWRLVVVVVGLDLDDAPPPFRGLVVGVGPRQIDRGLALDG